MPKKLIPPGWVENPCKYLLPTDSPSATHCGECGEEFSLWNGRRHCMFCGYIFHRNSCTSKVHTPGQFFRQRICLSCLYYKRTAASLLSQGEEFECLNSEGCSSVVHISLCEETAELVLCWKARALKETVDLSVVEVRKGISHMARSLESSVASYDPLRCLSLFLRDPQTTYQLKAPSALTCQRWVEGLKTASYVYGHMLEQAAAEEQYVEEEKGAANSSDTSGLLVSSSSKWYRRRYLPVPPLPSSSSPAFSEEWDNIPFPGTTSAMSEACGFSTSAVFPFPPPVQGSLGTSNSSGYLSDLSFSLHSNQILPRWPLSAHLPSNKTTRKRNTIGTTSTRSLPATPYLPSAAVHSVPPSTGASSACSTPRLLPSSSSSSSCSCHTARTIPVSKSSRVQSAGWLTSHLTWGQATPTSLATDNCCDHCRTYCRLVAELDS